MNTDQVILYLIGLFILCAVIGVGLWFEHVRQAKVQREKEEASRRAQSEAQEKMAAKERALAEFLSFAKDPANGEVFLTSAFGWHSRFNWYSIMEAAAAKSVNLEAVVTQSIFVAFQSAHRSGRVTPEACAVMAAQLRKAAEEGHSTKLEEMVGWFATRCPEVFEKTAGLLRTEIESCEAELKRLSGCWSTGGTIADEAEGYERQRAKTQSTLKLLESIRVGKR